MILFVQLHKNGDHYMDVIMTTMGSQITSLTIVYSTVYSGADQRKHQSSASLAFVWGIHRDRWIPRTKGQLRGKCFHLMTSSWVMITDIVNMYLCTNCLECHYIQIVWCRRNATPVRKQWSYVSKPRDVSFALHHGYKGPRDKEVSSRGPASLMSKPNNCK